MGRRALPKTDPSLDISKHFRTVEELVAAPWDPTAPFSRGAPLEVEVGSGKGLFLQNAALATPNHNFLGVEVAYKYARFIAHRLAKHEIPNAIAVQGDGLRLFRNSIPADSLAAVHVYFPDPWWKARHHKRRVMTEAFLADVTRTLEPGGRLHFWTDVKEYFDNTLDLIAKTTPLVGPIEVPQRDAAHDLDYRTHFERRMRLHNEPVYRSEFVK
jgi:tRNA (guanine-N7-)-methyltransferase